MRRHAAMVLGLVVPLAVSVAALAQPGRNPPRVGSDAGAAASASAVADGGTVAASSATAVPAPSATTAIASDDAGAPRADPNAQAPNRGMTGESYQVRLRDLEEKVDQLKDQIRRSHARLALLSDTIIGGGGAGSRSEVVFHNEMSSAFRLIRALFVLDGQVQYNRSDDTGALADQKEIPVYSGSVPPGDHQITVVLNFQGNGYGIFTYLRGYKFEVKSSHSFTAVEGKTIQVNATALEKGGVTTPLEQRPAIEWHEKVLPLGAGATTAAPAGGAR